MACHHFVAAAPSTGIWFQSVVFSSSSAFTAASVCLPNHVMIRGPQLSLWAISCLGNQVLIRRLDWTRVDLFVYPESLARFIRYISTSKREKEE